MRTAFARRPLTLLLAIGAIAALAVGAFAASPLWARGNLIPFAEPGDNPNNDVRIGSLLLAPGASQPWHYHSGPFYGVVQQGVLVEDLGCGRVKEFPAGTAFHTPAGVPHQFRNEGQPAVQGMTFQVWDGGLPFNVMVAEPTDCP